MCGAALVLLAMLLISAWRFSHRHGLQAAASARFQGATETQPLTEAADNSSSLELGSNGPTQSVHGQKVSYSLSLPTEWKTQSIAVDGVDNLSASQGAANLAVMVQESKITTPAQAASAALAFLKESATELHATDPAWVILDGRPWQKFTVKCRVQQAQLAYQYYIYSGAEGTYQLVAWAEQKDFERELDRMRSIIHSFRFPPENPRSAKVPANRPTTASIRGDAP